MRQTRAMDQRDNQHNHKATHHRTLHPCYQLWTRSCDATISHILIHPTLATFLPNPWLPRGSEFTCSPCFPSCPALGVNSAWQALCASTFAVPESSPASRFVVQQWLGRAQTSGFPTLWRMPCKQNSASRRECWVMEWKMSLSNLSVCPRKTSMSHNFP